MTPRQEAELEFDLTCELYHNFVAAASFSGGEDLPTRKAARACLAQLRAMCKVTGRAKLKALRAELDQLDLEDRA